MTETMLAGCSAVIIIDSALCKHKLLQVDAAKETADDNKEKRIANTVELWLAN